MKSVNIMDVSEWDTLVKKTYGKHYSFQQQEGCRDRGVMYFNVPEEYPEDFEKDSVPEEVNHEEMGVSFRAWLDRDPKEPLASKERDSNYTWCLNMWWERNFYPDAQMLVNDLHAKGLLPSGEFGIDVNW